MNRFKPNESDTIKQISDWLSINHIVHWRINSGACTGINEDKYGRIKKRFVRFIRFLYPKNEGYKLPDLEIFYLGITIYAEVKRPGKHKDDPGQDKFLRMIIEGGGYAVKINCLQDMINVIHDISNSYIRIERQYEFNGYGL